MGQLPTLYLIINNHNMDLKIILILTLVAVLCECRSARMTKEWPPSGKRSLNPWNRMSKTNKRDLNPWNRMSKTGEKRDAQGAALEGFLPFLAASNISSASHLALSIMI